MLSAKRIKTNLSSLSAHTIASNDDLLAEILVRLPIKSLFRFRSVSKNWLSLITNAHFSRRLNLSDSPCGLFVHTWSRSVSKFDFINLDPKRFDAPFTTLTFVNDPSQIKIIHSCNGLLLCSSFRTSSFEANYYIYNPTTKQYTILSPLGEDGEICGLYLAFDPLKSPHYKVICVLQCNIEQPDYEIEIYSAEIGAWRVSAATFSLDYDIGFYGGVFWNGGIHWYTDSGSCLYLDVDEEEIKEMPMPPFPEDWYRRRVMYFGESRGHLYLVEIYHPPSTQFTVCELETDYSGWCVKYRVNLDGVVSEFPEMIRTYLDPSVLNYYVFQIMCIVRGDNEEDDFSYMVLHIPEMIIRYELKDNSFKKLCDFPPGNNASLNQNRVHAGKFYEYIESYTCV